MSLKRIDIPGYANKGTHPSSERESVSLNKASTVYNSIELPMPTIHAIIFYLNVALSSLSNFYNITPCFYFIGFPHILQRVFCF